MTPRPRWWRRPLTFTTAVALALHLPFTPLVPFMRTLQRLSILREAPREEEPPDLPPMAVELLETPRPTPVGENAVALPPPPAPGKPAEPPRAEPPRAEPPKAEAKKNDKKQKKEPPKKAAEPDKEPEKEPELIAHGDDQPPAEAQSPDGEASPRPDSTGLKGKLSEQLRGKPPVSMTLWLGPVRGHPLGGAVGELMGCNPDWKPFLQKGLDPLRELEGFAMVGPSLTSSKKATIAVQHRVEPPRVRQILEALIQRSGSSGKWLQEGAAQVLIQRSERVMFEAPGSMLFVAPKSTWKALQGQPPLSLPEAQGRALSLAIQQPGKALRRFAVDLPSSVAELRVDLFANADGSVDVQLDLADQSDEKASAHARPISEHLGQLVADTAQIARTAASLAPVDVADVQAEDLRIALPAFSVVGPRLTSTMRLSAAQTGKLLGLFARVTCPKKGPPKPRLPPRACPVAPPAHRVKPERHRLAQRPREKNAKSLLACRGIRLAQ